MAKRGAFIVIEGLDRSGKTTQTQRLSEYLGKTSKVKLIKFPGNYSNRVVRRMASDVIFLDRTTPIGKMIHAYLCSQAELDDRAIHLLFSANRWESAYVCSVLK
jgi:dTMP kinase